MRYFYIILILLVYSSSYSDELIFTSDDFCPYYCANEKENGIIGDIVKHIFESKGHKVSFRTIPWSRIKKSMNLYTGVLAMIKTKSFDFVYPEEEASVAKACFYVKKGSKWHFEGINSLKNIRIGLVQDYEYDALGPEFKAFRSANKHMIQYLTGKNANILNFKKLIYDRFETTLNDRNITSYILKKLDIKDQIAEAGCLDSEVILYVVFPTSHLKSHVYAKMFDKGIRDLRNSGKLDLILAKYGVNDWK